MNLSRKWLGEFVDVDVNDKDFAEIMTIAGSKVETYARLDAEIKNVVVGKVLSMVRHPNSDHMWICQVDVGQGEPTQIVTGAQNVHEGDLVPVAQHNSYLPGGIHITKGKLRGEASNGMLCSLKELGLTRNDFPYAIEDGIWILQEDCAVGQDIHIFVAHVNINGVIPVSTADLIFELKTHNLRRLTQPPVICFLSCQTGTVDSGLLSGSDTDGLSVFYVADRVGLGIF